MAPGGGCILVRDRHRLVQHGQRLREPVEPDQFADDRCLPFEGSGLCARLRLEPRQPALGGGHRVEAAGILGADRIEAPVC